MTMKKAAGLLMVLALLAGCAGTPVEQMDDGKTKDDSACTSDSSDKDCKDAKEQKDVSFDLFDDTYMFSSGSKDWATTLTLKDDGSFTGYYADTSANTDNKDAKSQTEWCAFKGQFTDLKQVSDTQYTAVLKDLMIKGKAGDEVMDQESKVKFVNKGVPYGLDHCRTITIYTSDCDEEDLPRSVQAWNWTDSSKINKTIIMNNEDEYAFIQSDNLPDQPQPPQKDSQDSKDNSQKDDKDKDDKDADEEKSSSDDSSKSDDASSQEKPAVPDPAAADAIFQDVNQKKLLYETGNYGTIADTPSINAYGKEYYEVLDDSIHSIADIHAKFLKEVASKYRDLMDQWAAQAETASLPYYEQDGKLYALKAPAGFTGPLPYCAELIEQSDDQAVYRMEIKDEAGKVVNSDYGQFILVLEDGQWKYGYRVYY